MRAVPFLLLSSALIASGCFGATTEEPAATDGPAPPAAPAELAFRAPVAPPMDDGGPQEGTEPSVTVDSNGNVFVTAARGVRISPNPSQSVRGSWLWASNDGGASFRTIASLEGTQPNAAPIGAEGALDANGEGRVYFVDLVHLASVQVSATSDGGKSWEIRTPAANGVPGGDREWVAAGPGEKVFAAWNQLSTGYWVFASEDGGRTWPVQTLFPGTGPIGTPGESGGPTFAGTLAAGPDGAVYALRGEAGGVALYTSRDGARTFTRTVAWKPAGDYGFIFSTVAVDSAGTVYVTTVDSVNETARVRYAYSHDGGATFSAPREVTAAPGVHAMAWSAAGAPGRYAAAFYENPAANGTPDRADGMWFVRVVRSDQADRPDAAFEEGRPVASAVHKGPICTQGLACREQGERALGDYLGVDVGSAGDVHVAWVDSTTDASKVWYARTG